MNACQTTEPEFHFRDEDRDFILSLRARCPDCGGIPTMLRRHEAFGLLLQPGFRVVCESCKFGMEVGPFRDSQSAVRVWNTYSKLVNS